MSVMLMKTSTPRAGDEENRFPVHYGEADQMARFSSIGGCRYNNGSDRVKGVTILAWCCQSYVQKRWVNVRQGILLVDYPRGFQGI